MYIDSLPSATPRGGNIGPNYMSISATSPSSAGCARLPTSARRRCSISRRPASTPTSTSKPSPRAPTTRPFTVRCSGASPSDRAPWWGPPMTPSSGRGLRGLRGSARTIPRLLRARTGHPLLRHRRPHPESWRGSQACRHSRLHGPLSRRDNPDRRLGGYPGNPKRSISIFAQQRADAAASLLALEGVDPSRIGASGALGFGETQQFSQHGTAAGATQPITAGRLPGQSPGRDPLRPHGLESSDRHAMSDDIARLIATINDGPDPSHGDLTRPCTRWFGSASRRYQRCCRCSRATTSGRACGRSECSSVRRAPGCANAGPALSGSREADYAWMKLWQDNGAYDWEATAAARAAALALWRRWLSEQAG